jgi:NAD(P)-dependent dehydrogenase (short-subunit alcohol dehydrogenase family)
MGKLDGRVAILTGAAGGIGRGILATLVTEGCRVVATDLKQEALDAARGRTRRPGVRRDAGRRHHETRRRATRREDGDRPLRPARRPRQQRLRLAQQAARRMHRRRHGARAGHGVWATFFFMQECYPHLKVRGGSIVNFGSGAAVMGQPKNGTYAASKEGVRGMSRTATREWGPDRIRINVVLPFASSPAMIQWGKEFPDLYRNALANVALGYAGDPKDDIAPVVAWLLSDESRYVTGQTIAIDGGQVVRP